MQEFYFSKKYLSANGVLDLAAIKPKASQQLQKKMVVEAVRYGHTGIRLLSTYHKLAYLASLYFADFENQTLTFTDAVLADLSAQGNLAAKAFKVIADAYGIQFTLTVSGLSDVEDLAYLEEMLGTISLDELLAFLLDKSSWIEIGEGYVEGQGITEYVGTSLKTKEDTQYRPYFEYLQVPAPRTFSNVKILGDWNCGSLYSRYGKPLSNVLTPEELEQFHKEAVVIQISVATKFSKESLPPMKMLPYVLCKHKRLRCSSNVRVYRLNFASDVEITVKVPSTLYHKLWYNIGLDSKELPFN